jgi:thiamine biosynthesis lipoprotein
VSVALATEVSGVSGITGVTEVTEVTEHRGRIMGTDLHLVAVGGARAGRDAVARACARLALLEARWSRFRPTSELSRAATAAGTWVDVSEDTVRLVAAGLAAHERTQGRCDMTGGAAIAAAGYDRDLDERRRRGAATARPSTPFPGPDAVELDATSRRLRLAPGTVLDAGAVGKGLAADLVVAELLGVDHVAPGGPGTVDGLEGLCVNVGGDLRAAGRPPHGGDAWGVDVVLPEQVLPEPVVAELAVPAVPAVPAAPRWSMREGAVATSSSVRRVWDTTAGPVHHVLDPRTGAPAVAPPLLVSVHAGAAWWAEASATALMLLDAGERDAWAAAAGIAALVVAPDGTTMRHGAVDGRLA